MSPATTGVLGTQCRDGIDASGQPRGIVVKLGRAIGVGPIGRLELIPADALPAQEAIS